MPRITTAADLRQWLSGHRVHTFSVPNARVRYIAGFDSRNVTAHIEVSADVMREVDDLVWQHDPEGHRLPEKTMFALRSQLTPLN